MMVIIHQLRLGDPEMYSCYGQWSACDHELTCLYSKACYHYEEDREEFIAECIERDQPGELEEYKEENYNGSDDQL